MGIEVPEAWRLSPQHFQKKLADLISESRAFAVADDLDSISLLLSDWLPSIRRLFTEAMAVLEDLEEVVEQATSERADVRQSWSRATGTLILPRAFEELADLCFIAAVECRACLKELDGLSSESEQFTLLVVMERSQSRLSAGLYAVETRLARMSGRDSKTRHVDLGRKSLRARALIGRFRRRIASVSGQAENDMEKRVRAIGNSFAWLLGHDHFSNLRASDRLTAKVLHGRTLGWLRGARRPRPSSTTCAPPLSAHSSSSGSIDDDGQRLLEDVTAFIELLGLINDRPEVVQHDLRNVLEIMSVLADSDPHGPLPCSVVGPLNSILGRDEELDEMLGTDADAARVLARLLKIYSMLEREGTAPGHPGPEPPTGGLGDATGAARAAGRGRLGSPAAGKRSGPEARGRKARVVA